MDDNVARIGCGSIDKVNSDSNELIGITHNDKALSLRKRFFLLSHEIIENAEARVVLPRLNRLACRHPPVA